MYLAFGTFNYLIYGDELSTTPLITKILPQGTPFVAISELIYMFALIITYPLVINPTNQVIENYLFKGMPFSNK